MVTDHILEILLKTKDESHSIAVAALGNEIVGLKRYIEKIEEQIRYERARADGLVDRLLVRDARVAAVAPSAVAAAAHKDEKAAEGLKRIFDEINLAGVEIPSTEKRAVDIAGGTAIDPGHSGGY